MSPTAEEVRQFLDRLIKLTQDELEYEESESAILFSQAPFAILEARGLALGNLAASKSTVGLGGRTLLELERSTAYSSSPTFPPHSFRPGDICEVVDHAAGRKVGKEKDTASIEGVVWKVLETKVVISLGRGGGVANGENKAEEMDVPERIRLLKISNPSTYTRQLFALNKLNRQIFPYPDSPMVSLPPLLSVLLGFSSPTVNAAPPPLWIDSTLNDSQREAITWSLRAAEVALIWGPPGTGKTQSLVEVVRQLVREGKRVLICGGSNLSVDNLLQRLSLPTSFPPIPLTRIGHPARVLSSLVPHTLDSQSLRTNSSEVLVGIKDEMEALEKELRGGSPSSGKRMRGKERREKWGEVRILRKEYRQREGGVVKEVLSRAKVVLATCHGAGNKLLEKEVFDVLIIDEAAQAVEPSCWVPILSSQAKKLILAGDHLQLPPTIKSTNSSAKKAKKVPNDTVVKSILNTNEPASLTPSQDSVTQDLLSLSLADSKAKPPMQTLRPSSSLEVTLFSRLLDLHGPNIRRMLTTQYRFNQTIMDFPSKTLYQNGLLADSTVQSRKLSDLEEVEPDEDLDEPVVFFDTAGTSMYERSAEEGSKSFGADSKSNENEASLCVNYVKYLIEAGVLPKYISIISPYNSQVSLLASLVHPEYPDIEIGSVDGFQGRECEVVIISLVRSNDKGEVGFLAEKRRLNVAMTRARSQLVIVGDSETVSKGSKYLKDWMNWLEENAAVRMADL